MIWLAPLAGFGVSTAEAVEEAVGKFRKHPRWKFLFVDHRTTNPLFVPAGYDTEDACALLGCTYQWSGSEKSIATDIFNAPGLPLLEKSDFGTKVSGDRPSPS